KGTVEKLAPKSPYAEGKEIEVKLGEVGLHDPESAMAKVDGYDVCVGEAARLVGKKVKVRVERVLDGTIYASLVGAAGAAAPAPITAEGLAEKPTRATGRKGAEPAAAPEPEPEPQPVEAEVEVEKAEAPGEAEKAADAEGAAQAPRQRGRRGSRGGRRRRKPAGAAVAEGNGAVESGAADSGAPRIHLPDPALGTEAAEEPSDNGDQPARKRRSRSRRRPAQAKPPAEAAA